MDSATVSPQHREMLRRRLMAMAHHGSLEVRRAAALGLGACVPHLTPDALEGAVSTLVARSKDAAPQVREAAALGLGACVPYLAPDALEETVSRGIASKYPKILSA